MGVFTPLEQTDRSSNQSQDLTSMYFYSENACLDFSKCLPNAQFGNNSFLRVVSTLIISTHLKLDLLFSTLYIVSWKYLLPYDPQMTFVVLQYSSDMLQGLTFLYLGQ